MENEDDCHILNDLDLENKPELKECEWTQTSFRYVTHVKIIITDTFHKNQTPHDAEVMGQGSSKFIPIECYVTFGHNQIVSNAVYNDNVHVVTVCLIFSPI